MISFMVEDHGLEIVIITESLEQLVTFVLVSWSVRSISITSYIYKTCGEIFRDLVYSSLESSQAGKELSFLSSSGEIYVDMGSGL